MSLTFPRFTCKRLLRILPVNHPVLVEIEQADRYLGGVEPAKEKPEPALRKIYAKCMLGCRQRFAMNH